MEVAAVADERLLKYCELPDQEEEVPESWAYPFSSAAVEQLLSSLLLPNQHMPDILGIASPLTYPPQKCFHNRWVLKKMNDLQASALPQPVKRLT